MTWNPWTTWWMDLLKFSITFSLGAVFTIGILDRLTARRNTEYQRCQTVIDAKTKAANEFAARSLTYREQAYNAWTELYRWRERDLTAPMRRYTEDAKEGLFAAMEDVSRRFADTKNKELVQQKVDTVKLASHDLWRVYDTLIDNRLDELEKKETVPQISRSTLEKARPTFESKREVFAQARLDLIELLDQILYSSPFDVLCPKLAKRL